MFVALNKNITNRYSSTPDPFGTSDLTVSLLAKSSMESTAVLKTGIDSSDVYAAVK